MIEKMTVEDGHAPDDWVGEIHDDVDGATYRNVHCVHPQWVRDWLIVFGVRKEMDLMDVHGMQFPAGIDNLPMLERSNFCMHHRSRICRELFTVDVEAILVFREDHSESRRRFFFRREIP